MEFIDLVSIAKELLGRIELYPRAKCSWVATALETKNGNIYTGMNIDLVCGVGICAEGVAISDMIKHGESIINKIVTVTENGEIRPPCGKCREMISLVSLNNIDTLIMLPKNTIVTLKELLPYDWKEK